MRSTDVVHVYRDNEASEGDDFQLLPTGRACRLFSLQIRPRADFPGGTNGVAGIILRDGDASGTIKFKFGYRSIHASVENAYNIPVITFPAHGMRFDDGIFVGQVVLAEGVTRGVFSATATVQGVTDHYSSEAS